MNRRYSSGKSIPEGGDKSDTGVFQGEPGDQYSVAE